MQEIDPDLLQHVANPASASSYPSYKGGTIAVDSIEGCLNEAGELVKAAIPVQKMMELGKILQAKSQSGDDELVQWLERGFLVYKSVGIGVMDLATGHHLLSQAGSHSIGLHLDSL